MRIFTTENNKDIENIFNGHGLSLDDCKNLQFVCDTYSTSRSWGHKGKVLRNGFDTGITHRIRYYNRTWESYEYESLLHNLIGKYIKQYKGVHHE